MALGEEWPTIPMFTNKKGERESFGKPSKKSSLFFWLSASASPQALLLCMTITSYQLPVTTHKSPTAPLGRNHTKTGFHPGASKIHSHESNVSSFRLLTNSCWSLWPRQHSTAEHSTAQLYISCTQCTLTKLHGVAAPTHRYQRATETQWGRDHNKPSRSDSTLHSSAKVFCLKPTPVINQSITKWISERCQTALPSP